MTREEFESLVRRVENRRDPTGRKLRFSVVLLALLSYASLFAWLGAAFLVAVPLAWGGLALGIDAGGWILLSLGAIIAAIGLVTTLAVLRVRIKGPEGLEIRRGDAPALFALLDDLRARLRSAPVSRVVLSWDCNAGVYAVPRLGLLGWPRHHLELGLPLLEVLSMDELRGVLAHELAHISAQHGRLGGWIYRLRRSWMQAFAQLEQRRTRRRVSLDGALRQFFDWFWPRFNAHAFVLSRLNEFEADALAVRLSGPEQMSGALLGIRLYGRLLEENFWPDLWRGVAQTPDPPADVFTRLRATLDAGVPAREAAQWLHEAYRVFTTHDDTHPCLTERLQAMGQTRFSQPPAEFPVPARPSAAAELFGERLGEFQDKLAARWQEAAKENWHIQRAKARVFQTQQEAQARAATPTKSDVETLWEQARTVAELHGPAQAEGLLRQILALRPTHPAGNFLLGSHLLSQGDPAGAEHLERAMTADEDFVPPAAGLLSEHFTRNGEAGKVRELRARLDRHDARVAASHAERNRVTAHDHFVPHLLPPEALEPVCAVLRTEPELAAAYLVRKELRHFPEQKLFVLVIALARSWYTPPNAAKTTALIGRIMGKVYLPGRLLIVGESGAFAEVARKAKNVADAQIFAGRGG